MIKPLLLLALLLSSIDSAADSPAAAARVVESGGYSVTLAPVPDWVTPRTMRTTWPKDAPGASGVATRAWLFDSQTDLRDGATTRYLEYTHQVLSAQALAQSAQVQWQFEPNYQTLTLHAVDIIRDGKVSTRIAAERITLTRRESDFERLMLDGMVTMLMVLPDVQVDDIIRLRISVAGSNPILSGHTAQFFSLRTDIPVLDRHVRILADANDRLTWRSSDTQFALTSTDTRNGREWLHSSERLEAARFDADMPYWWSPYGELVVSDRRSWKDVSRWAAQLYPTSESLRIAEKVAALRKAGDGDGERQILAALRFVQDEIRYFGVEMGSSTHRPALPDSVIERRFGDCKDKARLLSALLTGLGFDAVPALVSATRGRAIEQHPPNAASFDHVIVRLRFQDKTYWLDPTLTLQRGTLDSLGFPAYDLALPIADDSTALVAMQAPSTYRNEAAISEKFEPGPDATMQLEVQTRYRGAWADTTRREIAASAASELQKQWTDYYARILDGATALSDFSVKDDETRNELVVTERYRLPTLWRSSGELTSYVDLSAYAIAQRLNLNVSTDRKSPLALYHPARFEHVTLLTPPARAKLKLSAESASVDADAFTYSRALSLHDNTLRLEHRVDSKAGHVAIDDLPEYLEQLKQVREGNSTRISIAFDNPNATPRNERLRNVLNDLMREDKNEKQ